MASLPQSSPTPSMSISLSFHLTFLDALVAESVPTLPFSIPKKVSIASSYLVLSLDPYFPPLAVQDPLFLPFIHPRPLFRHPLFSMNFPSYFF